MKRSILSAGAGLLGFAIAGLANANPSYDPFGPQNNVALATVTGGGWTQCYLATMAVSIGTNAENVLNPCDGDLLMMAGRRTGSDTLLVLAEAAIADVTFNTGAANNGVTHVANGTEWYFAPNYSWGFAGLGDAVTKIQCDTNSPTETDRMCLHTIAGVGGWRIANFTNLNANTGFEKVFFEASVPEPASIALVSLGLLGLGLRRRKA